MIRIPYRTWFEFTGWLLCLIGWLFWLQGQIWWWQPLVLWVLVMVLFFLTRGLGYDAGAMPFMAVLAMTGWIFLTRLSPAWAASHTWGILIAGLAYLLGLWTGSKSFGHPLVWAGLAIGLLAATALFGQSAGGARAWISLFGLRFQPVEAARIFLVFYLAHYFTEGRSKRELFAVLGSFLLILAWQRDLGPALLVFFVFCWLSLHWQFSWLKLCGYLAVSVLGFVLACQWFPHFQNRVVAWTQPWEYLDSIGYQVLQGLFALRSGGLAGRGLGAGYVQVIPNVHTDYLFAVIGEEFGFLGTFALLMVYLGLAFWSLRLVHVMTEPRRQLIGLGLTLLLHLQVFLVVGGILRIVPFSGMTLPFVSFGSTSLAAQLGMVGIVAGLGGKGGGD